MTRLWSIARKFRTLANSGPRRQALVVEASARMLAARVSILVRPANQVMRRLAETVAAGDARALASGPLASATVRIIREVSWAVRSAAPFLPFRSVCLQQAMAARAILRRPAGV